MATGFCIALPHECHFIVADPADPSTIRVVPHFHICVSGTTLETIGIQRSDFVEVPLAVGQTGPQAIAAIKTAIVAKCASFGLDVSDNNSIAMPQWMKL